MMFLLQLGHEAYEPGTRAYSEIVAEFGREVVGEDGRIDRKVLGPVVFGNKVMDVGGQGEQGNGCGGSGGTR